MFEVPDTHVASVAQQAADAASIVAMIDVKAFGFAASSAWFVCFADCALALLFFQHFCVRTRRYPVQRLKQCIVRSFGVFSPPFAHVVSLVFLVPRVFTAALVHLFVEFLFLFRVVSSPLVPYGTVARTAKIASAERFIFVSCKLFDRFSFFATVATPESFWTQGRRFALAQGVLPRSVSMAYRI